MWRDIFTGEKLSAGERALTALGLLAGSGAYWRNIARGIDKEAARLGLGGVRKSADDAVIKIEKHAADKSSVSAYDIAKSGGKNSGLYNQYYRKTDKELKNSIRSYQKQLDFHREKIKHPEKYISNYDKRKPEYIDGTVKHWKKEIETFSEQKEIIEGILIERGIL